jgi:hypothetical protein
LHQDRIRGLEENFVGVKNAAFVNEEDYQHAERILVKCKEPKPKCAPIPENIRAAAARANKLLQKKVPRPKSPRSKKYIDKFKDYLQDKR